MLGAHDIVMTWNMTATTSMTQTFFRSAAIIITKRISLNLTKNISVTHKQLFVTLLFFAVVSTGVIAADISEIIADNLFAVVVFAH